MKNSPNIYLVMVLGVFTSDVSLATKRVADEEWPTASSLRLMTAHNSPVSSPSKAKKEETIFLHLDDEAAIEGVQSRDASPVRTVGNPSIINAKGHAIKNLDWGRKYKSEKFLPAKPKGKSGAQRKLNF